MQSKAETGKRKSTPEIVIVTIQVCKDSPKTQVNIDLPYIPLSAMPYSVMAPCQPPYTILSPVYGATVLRTD